MPEGVIPWHEVLADPAALAERVAAWLLDLARAKNGTFAICLSGGSTPKALYARLAQAPYRDAFRSAYLRGYDRNFNR